MALCPDLPLEWVIRFNSFSWTSDIKLHVTHTSHVIITYTMKLSSSPTNISQNLQVTINFNKNTLEACKNPRPTSSWSELTKSCTTSTLNFHMAYFSWIPQNNARSKLSLVNQNVILVNISHLTTSHGMDYVLNEHLDFKPTWSTCNTISDNIVI